MNVRIYGHEHTPVRTRIFVPNFDSNLDIVTIFSTSELFSVKHMVISRVILEMTTLLGPELLKLVQKYVK